MVAEPGLPFGHGRGREGVTDEVTVPASPLLRWSGGFQGSQEQPEEPSSLSKEEAINVSVSFNTVIGFLYTVQVVVTGKWLCAFS